jgi:hypothetical protein
MKKEILKLVLIIFGFTITNFSSAQMSDTIACVCTKHLAGKFISDGQQYRTLLVNSEETAEFHSTLFGGTIYRIAACSGLSDGNLIFWVYDTQRNLLFTNKDFKNAPYWDFKINNTLDCTIEAKLDGAKNSGSGRAVVLIGFKQ